MESDKEYQKILTEHLVLKEEIRKLQIKIISLEILISEKKKRLFEICPHHFTETIDKGIPGGYFDKSEHWTETYCKFCGKLLSRSGKTYGHFE